MPDYFGVKFADPAHLECLNEHGYCAFIIAEKDKSTNHPDIGDIVQLMHDESSSGRRSPVRLVADQHMSDGSMISIYIPAYSIFPAQD